MTDCGYLHNPFGAGCPHCTPKPIEALRVAWAMAPRYKELDAWRRLYDALYPAPDSRERSTAS